MKELLTYFEVHPWTNNVDNCLIIGVNAITKSGDMDLGFIKKIAEKINPEVKEGNWVNTIIEYNDNPKRTWEEVKQLLETIN